METYGAASWLRGWWGDWTTVTGIWLDWWSGDRADEAHGGLDVLPTTDEVLVKIVLPGAHALLDRSGSGRDVGVCPASADDIVGEVAKMLSVTELGGLCGRGTGNGGGSDEDGGLVHFERVVLKWILVSKIVDR